MSPQGMGTTYVQVTVRMYDICIWQNNNCACTLSNSYHGCSDKLTHRWGKNQLGNLSMNISLPLAIKQYNNVMGHRS